MAVRTGTTSTSTLGERIGSIFSQIMLIILMLLTFFPFVMLINMSLKANIRIKQAFFALPNPIKWANYTNALEFIKQPVLNSLFVCGVSLVLILIMVSMSGYAFGRMQFKGKEFLFTLLLAVLMIPYTLLIIPNYRIIARMGLLNNYLALILPYIGGQQIFGIVLARAYYASLPKDFFEAAKLDGADELQAYLRIALPLSFPTLITVGITVVVAMYNDYIWPTLVMTTNDKMKTFCQIVFNNAAGNGAPDLGLLAASFVLGTLPLLIITVPLLRYYTQGLLGGAIKG
ncbi:MAG: carbohydrate ABC transporter permease [Chloroflexi bacterium]|nr:carbohydrate ABC transporter permease [Chloroflexota bacterium]